MKSSVLTRKLQVYNPKLLKDLLSFGNTYFKEQFSVAASKNKIYKTEHGEQFKRKQVIINIIIPYICNEMVTKDYLFYFIYSLFNVDYITIKN